MLQYIAFLCQIKKNYDVTWTPSSCIIKISSVQQRNHSFKVRFHIFIINILHNYYNNYYSENYLYLYSYIPPLNLPLQTGPRFRSPAEAGSRLNGLNFFSTWLKYFTYTEQTIKIIYKINLLIYNTIHAENISPTLYSDPKIAFGGL